MGALFPPKKLTTFFSRRPQKQVSTVTANRQNTLHFQYGSKCPLPILVGAHATELPEYILWPSATERGGLIKK